MVIVHIKHTQFIPAMKMKKITGMITIRSEKTAKNSWLTIYQNKMWFLTRYSCYILSVCFFALLVKQTVMTRTIVKNNNINSLRKALIKIKYSARVETLKNKMTRTLMSANDPISVIGQLSKGIQWLQNKHTF